LNTNCYREAIKSQPLTTVNIHETTGDSGEWTVDKRTIDSG